LRKENTDFEEVILQNIPQDRPYDHPTAVAYARRLGLAIQGEGDPNQWRPTEEEQT